MPSNTEPSSLRIYGDRLGTVKELTQFLNDLQNAYNGVYVFHSLVDSYSRYLYDKRFIARLIDFRLPPASYWQDYHNRSVDSIEPRDQLIISKINIQSPGWWEVIGSLNPLQQIREFLKDRHERRKDTQWREATERDKAILENELIQRQITEADNRNLGERIRVLRELGFSDKEIRELIWINVGKPLNELGKHQDTGLIGGVD